MPDDLNPEASWFGASRVTPEAKTARVRGVFASVAPRYDLMNDLMSGGLHRLWKDRLVRHMRPRPGQAILDVAGGTGDIGLRCAARTQGLARIYSGDINPSMLAEGRRKALDQGWLEGLSWLNLDAESLPFADRTLDTVSIAFGLRNVTRIDAALAEFARVLKPSGRFLCLEFTPNVSPRLKRFYDRYCATILPLLGRVVAGDEDSYRYLAESIHRFPSQQALAGRMAKAGFSHVRWHNLTGGVAVIHEGWRL